MFRQNLSFRESRYCERIDASWQLTFMISLASRLDTRRVIHCHTVTERVCFFITDGKYVAYASRRPTSTWCTQTCEHYRAAKEHLHCRHQVFGFPNISAHSWGIKLPEKLRTVPDNVIANRPTNGIMPLIVVRKTRWKILPTVQLFEVLLALGILL